MYGYIQGTIVPCDIIVLNESLNVIITSAKVDSPDEYLQYMNTQTFRKKTIKTKQPKHNTRPLSRKKLHSGRIQNHASHIL